VEFQDMDGNHVGIDLNSMVSVNSSSAGYRYDEIVSEGTNLTRTNFEALRLSSGNPMQARFTISAK
jgi:hypothetical protein